MLSGSVHFTFFTGEGFHRGCESIREELIAKEIVDEIRAGVLVIFS